MTRDTDASAAARRDRSVEQYILALERGDFDAVATILAAAGSDPELDRLLVEVDGALHDEARLTTRAEDAKTVRQLLMRHLPSAFVEPETGPPSVGDVAARLQSDHASGQQPLLLGDLTANNQVLGNHTVVAGRLTPQTIRQITAPLGVQASDRYWKLFHQAAVELALARTGRATHQAAARPRSPRRKDALGPASEEP